MKAPGLAAALLLTTGCSVDVDDSSVPSVGDIERLEAVLSQHPCVGDVNRWERSYRFSRKTGLISDYAFNPDFDVIEFHLRRAGTILIRPRMNVLTPTPGGDWPDSSPIRSVDGRFTLGSGKLTVARCDPLPRT